jgi:hypothetical protein
MTRVQVSGFGGPSRARDFSVFQRVQICSGSRPASHLMGTVGFSLVLKQPGPEAEN